MKRSKFTNVAEVKTKDYHSMDTRGIEPYDVKSSMAPQSLGSQLTSHSSGESPLGHTNLLQQPQYSGILCTQI
jgi:hypothetical protein